MTLLKNSPKKQAAIKQRSEAQKTSREQPVQRVAIKDSITTGFLLGIGFQISVLAIWPALACLAAIGMAVLGVM